MLVPFLTGREARALHDRIRDVAQPARVQADRVQEAVIREVGAMRGYLATRDSAFLRQYREARTDRERARRSFAPYVRGLGPEVERSVARLDAEAARWEAPHDLLLRGRLSPDSLARRLAAGGDRARQASEAAAAVEDAAYRAEAGWRAEIDRIERRGRIWTVVLALLAVAAAVAVAWSARRSRRLAAERDRQARTNRLLLASTAEAIYGLDAAGRLTFLNPAGARMLGCALDQVLGRPAAEVLHLFPDGAEAGREAESPMLRLPAPGERERTGREVVRRADGSTFHAEYSVSPVVEGGVMRGAVVAFADVSARIAQQQALEEATAELEATAEELRERSQEAQELRELAEAAAERDHFLADFGNTVAQSLDYGETVQAICRQLVPRVADACTVYVEGGGRVSPLGTAAAPGRAGLHGVLEQAFLDDSGTATHPVRRVLDSGERILVPGSHEAAGDHAELARLLRDAGVGALALVPLRARGRTRGVLALSAAESRPRLSAEELALAEEVGRRAALALDSASLYRRAREELAERERAEGAARASEARYRAVAENFPNGALLVFDRDLRYLLAGGAGLADAGLRPDQLEGRTVFEVFPPETVAGIAPAYRAALEGRSSVAEVEFAGRIYQLHALPLPGDGAEIRAGLAMTQDVTAERRAEAALRVSERNYRFLADHIPQLVWTTRPDGFPEYRNRRWCEYTGLAAGEDGGEAWSVVHPEDRAPVEARWRTSLRTGEAYSVECRLRGRDGGYRWFLGQALPQRDGSGTIVRWFGTATDIQDQKEAAEALQRARAEVEVERSRLAGLFIQAPAAVAVLRGADHVFEIANPAYRELIGGTDLQGRPVRDALPHLAGQGFVDLLDRVYRSGEPYLGTEVPVRFPGRGGTTEERLFNFVYQPLFELGGEVSGVFVHAVDVTELVGARREVEHLYDEVRRANQAKSEFLASMSHELRTPLNAIGGYADLIEMGIHGPVTEAQTAALGRIKRSQRHLLVLINDILNFARLEAGRVQVRVEDVRIGEVLRDVESMLATQAQARELSLAVSPCAENVVARADAEKVAQVLVNLLTNAVKYTEPGGRIEAGCELDGARVVVRVRDTGIGIPEDRLSTIFDPFVQVGRKLDRPAEGVGLGLAISRDLARRMGGDIEVESVVGRGSTFTFTIPRSTTAESGEPAERTLPEETP
ncbi:MAG: PAS domain-containing protein [Gemmatimonadota bacterium]